MLGLESWLSRQCKRPYPCLCRAAPALPIYRGSKERYTYEYKPLCHTRVNGTVESAAALYGTGSARWSRLSSYSKLQSMASSIGEKALENWVVADQVDADPLQTSRGKAQPSAQPPAHTHA